MEKRRKITIKTMEDMSVLDMTAGAMEQETEGVFSCLCVILYMCIYV
jgi:hypothetical protein